MINLNNDDAYDDKLLAEGQEYIVGTNDGSSFKDVIYLGTKLYHGKPIMVFQTKDKRQLTINPSYHSFTLEETMNNHNDITYTQSKINDIERAESYNNETHEER